MAKAKETKQLEAALAPVVEFNKLVVKNAEAAFNLQVQAMQAYAALGLKNLNAGLEVRNPEELKAYAEAQKDVAEQVTARMTADVKAMGELNTTFIDEARALAEQNVKAVAETAKAA